MSQAQFRTPTALTTRGMSRSKLEVKVLEILQQKKRMTIQEIVNKSGSNTATIHEILIEYMEDGLISRKKWGNVFVWTLKPIDKIKG